MRKFPFPRIHGPDHDLCIRSICLSHVSRSLHRKFTSFITVDSGVKITPTVFCEIEITLVFLLH